MADRVVLGGGLLASADAPLRMGWGVSIANGRVGDVAPNEELQARFPGADRIDARELLLMPGLVNAHMHSYGLLAHGLPLHDVPSGFYEFLKDFWWPRVEDRLDRPMIEAAMELACCRMIRSGTTAFCDVLEAPNAPAGILDAEAAIVRRAGLRAVLMTEASERIDTARGLELLEENVRFIRARRDADPVRGMLCLHTSFTCSRPFVERAVGLRADLDCGLHLHLSESDDEPAACLDRFGVRPTMWYDDIGLWNGSVLASQAVAVDADEIRLLARRNARVAHMPLSNCEVGGGIAPVPAIIEAGIRPGLGSDGYLNDPFEVMRGAFLIHKGAMRDPSVMPAGVVLHMATDWGARAIGLPDGGTIAPGANADLIGVDLRFDTPLCEENVLDQVVLHRTGADVRLSIVAGRVLMERGELLAVDEDAARARVHDQATRLWGGA